MLQHVCPELLPCSGLFLGCGVPGSLYAEQVLGQWRNMCRRSLGSCRVQLLSHDQRSCLSGNWLTLGCCPAQGNSWMNCGDGHHCEGGGSICGDRSS